MVESREARTADFVKLPYEVLESMSKRMRENKNKFPPGWNEERVQRVLAHYERQTEEEAVAEYEAACEHEYEGQTIMEIPKELEGS